MRAIFRERYACAAPFQEDAQLCAELAYQAAPALDALWTAHTAESGAPSAPHEAYALLALLARDAARLGATPGAALVLADAVAAALESAGAPVASDAAAALRVVTVEGYCGARDERVTSEWRELLANSQVTIAPAPGCSVLFLAGRLEQSALQALLESRARDLLRNDTKSCLLDLCRLELLDDEQARAIGHFCALAATLGVAVFVVGGTATLREQFARWSVGHGAQQFVDDYARGQALALAAAGYEVRPIRRWARLLGRRRSAVAS